MMQSLRVELRGAEPDGESVGHNSADLGAGPDPPTCTDVPPPAIGESGSTFLMVLATFSCTSWYLATSLTLGLLM